MPQKIFHTTIRLPLEMREKIKNICWEKRKSFAQFIKDYCEAEIKKYEENLKENK